MGLIPLPGSFKWEASGDNIVRGGPEHDLIVNISVYTKFTKFTPNLHQVYTKFTSHPVFFLGISTGWENANFLQTFYELCINLGIFMYVGLLYVNFSAISDMLCKLFLAISEPLSIVIGWQIS